VNGSWTPFVGSWACRSDHPEDGPTKDTTYEGIDLFAEICRHEARHKEQLQNQFGNYDIEHSQDLDEDCLLDSAEESMGGPSVGGPFDPEETDTDIDGATDCEDYACWTQVQ